MDWYEEMEQAEAEYEAELEDEARAYREGYEQGRADEINKLRDDYGNCLGTTMCNDCMFSKYGNIECIFKGV